MVYLFSFFLYPRINEDERKKCLCFCLQLDNKAHVRITEFKQINQLPVDYGFRQCLAANLFKFFDDKCPLYMKDVFDKSCISQASTGNSTMKLSQPLRKTNYGQHCISFLAPAVWNIFPNELKRCTNLNTFKHKIKEYFLNKIKQKDNDIYLYDYIFGFTTANAFFL